MNALRSLPRLAVVCLSVVMGAQLTGCASPAYSLSGDPLLDLRNPNLRPEQRVVAAQTVWDEVESGLRDRPRTRSALKDLAWSRSTPHELRLTAIGLLVSDDDPQGEADSRQMTLLMLPSEPSLSVVHVLSAAAAQQGWQDVAPALVRSYARPAGLGPRDETEPGAASPDDAARPERRALNELFPGRSVEETVYQVMLRPGHVGTEAQRALGWDDRVRGDAWALLSRLDPSGQTRTRLLAQTNTSGLDDGAREIVADLLAAERELGVLPQTAAELAWVRSLRRSGNDKNSAWWSQASGAVARLNSDQRRHLALRHVEPVRWASVHRPGLLSASRSDLYAELTERLSGREIKERRAEVGIATGFDLGKERPEDWSAILSWGDLLTLLVVDEAVRTPDIAPVLAEQVELDRADPSTEYGGVLESVPGEQASGDARFRVVLFRPRQRDRLGDEQFVASEDMIAYSDRALAHYHQQVQQRRNDRYAGPSGGDMAYAVSSGRTCVVFTSISGSRLNVDCYFPTGAVIDLGMIELDAD